MYAGAPPVLVARWLGARRDVEAGGFGGYRRDATRLAVEVPGPLFGAVGRDGDDALVGGEVRDAVVDDRGTYAQFAGSRSRASPGSGAPPGTRFAFVGPFPYECQSPPWNAAVSSSRRALHPASDPVSAVPRAVRAARRDGPRRDGSESVGGGRAGDRWGEGTGYPSGAVNKGLPVDSIAI
ncbi:hypothetical protein [Haloarcula laminariae]|uniref:hypothetical protein n=1 Tax=Haloarcula laminariae TaxID=2961577 RepID=UPI0021CA5122|nr:hypothetical protein [Halomicroarcula laminariae]